MMDPVLDGSSNKQQSLSKSAKLIQTFFNTANRTDPWIYIHTTPSPELIVVFFIDAKLLAAVKYVDYKAIVLSDYAPLKL